MIALTRREEPVPNTSPQPAAPPSDSGVVRHVPPGSYETVYVVLAVSFVAVLMLTNVIGTKLFSLPLDLPVVGPILRLADRIVQALFPGQGGGDALTLTAGIITYPITFLFTDVVSEIYGRRRADVMVMIGFVSSLIMLGVIAVARALTPAPIWNVPGRFAEVFAPDRLVGDGAGGVVADSVAAQAAYQFTFDAPGVLLLASMTAYLVAQLVDTIIVNTIFLHFYWKLSWPAIGGVIIASYTVKALMAFLDTPFCYAGVATVRRLVAGDPRTLPPASGSAT